MGALDPDEVNHALRHLRFTAATLYRVTRRAAGARDEEVFADILAVNRALQTYMLELSSEMSGSATPADEGKLDDAFSELTGEAKPGNVAMTHADNENVISYKDAYEQVRMALTELRRAMFGTTLSNDR